MTKVSAVNPGAHYDSVQHALVVEHLAVVDQAVLTESCRWSEGRRGPSVPADEMVGVDVSAFVTQAVIVGTHAIGSAGGVQETFNLESLVREVGERAADAATHAAKATSEVTTKAAADMESAAAAARKAITEAGTVARKSFSDNVDGAKKSLAEEIERLVGGVHPELLTRLAPLLEKFGRDLDERSDKQTSALIDKVVRQFDPADPTSPMSKHANELARQQASLSATLAANHKSLEAKVDELSTAFKVAKSAAAIASKTTLKGETYAQGIHRVMTEIAAGLGDEYSDTSATPGQISRCKKGDAVLAIDGGRVNVVLEMTDSKRTAWNPYLDEAERNRNAQASLGLVRSPQQLHDNWLQSYGSRRIVLASIRRRINPICCARSCNCSGSARSLRQLGRTVERSRPRRRRSQRRSHYWVGLTASRPARGRSKRAPLKSMPNPTRWQPISPVCCRRLSPHWPAPQPPAPGPSARPPDRSNRRGRSFRCCPIGQWWVGTRARLLLNWQNLL